MALLRYLQLRDSLPDPRGPLSSTIPAQAIAEANREVQEATSIGSKRTERGPYKQYSASVRAKIGKHASHHGVAAAARYFSKKLNCHVSKTTVQSTRSSYTEGVWKQRVKDEGDIVALPLRKCGRPLLLGQQLDTKVQLYLKKVRYSPQQCWNSLPFRATSNFSVKFGMHIAPFCKSFNANQ